MAINKIASYINHSQTAQKFLRGVSDNTAIFAAGASFLIASGLRPALIGCMGFKDSKDKKTSQASAIATGLVELLTTVAIFIPFNKAICNTSKSLYNKSNTVYHENKELLRQFKSVTNRATKILLLPAISFLRFALVKPITNLLTKKEKGERKIWA